MLFFTHRALLSLFVILHTDFVRPSKLFGRDYSRGTNDEAQFEVLCERSISWRRLLAPLHDLHIRNMSYAYAAGSNAFLFPRCMPCCSALAFSAFTIQLIKLHGRGRKSIFFTLVYFANISASLYFLWIFNAWWVIIDFQICALCAYHISDQISVIV